MGRFIPPTALTYPSSLNLGHPTLAITKIPPRKGPRNPIPFFNTEVYPLSLGDVSTASLLYIKKSPFHQTLCSSFLPYGIQFRASLFGSSLTGFLLVTVPAKGAVWGLCCESLFPFPEGGPLLFRTRLGPPFKKSTPPSLPRLPLPHKFKGSISPRELNPSTSGYVY